MLDWSEIVEGFNEENSRDLTEFIENQRWFGSKGRGIASIELVDQIVLRDQPRLVVALIEVRDGAGTPDVYQLILASAPKEETTRHDRFVTAVGETAILEASDDPRIAELMALATGDGIAVSSQSGEVRFRSIRNVVSAPYSTRALGAEQSNTSVVVNDRLLLKLYRRLEAGANPELELLLFLTEHDFRNIPSLTGWSLYSGASLRTTLALAQQFMPDSIDGWHLGMEELSHPDERFLERLNRLGQVVGEMHCVLVSDFNDPSFAPETPTDEAAPILGARLEGQIDELSDSLPPGRSDELRSLARILTEHPLTGMLIRTHGDLHLGQVLWTNDDWFIIDFEGEPARSLTERRQKFHPLRDIAGMLRSLSYLVAAHELEHQSQISPDWEQEAGERFLSSYRAQVASIGLLPGDLEVQDRLLRVFTLEKIIYELSYELQHRPSWVPVPLAGIDRLLASQME